MEELLKNLAFAKERYAKLMKMKFNRREIYLKQQYQAIRNLKQRIESYTGSSSTNSQTSSF